MPVASQRPSSARPDPLCKAAEQLVGVGSSVPETFLTNDDLAKLVDTNDEWIVTRTGIKKRHVLGKGETLVQHAVISSKRALEMAGVDAKDVDLVLFATSSPDDVFGSACQVRGDAARWGATLARPPPCANLGMSGLPLDTRIVLQTPFPIRTVRGPARAVTHR